MRRIALVSGFWGQNIGNAFVNAGGLHVMRRVFPGHHVDFVQDQPGYRTFHSQRRGNPRNAWDLVQRLDVDYVVLQGPLLTTTFRALWEESFAAFAKRGTRVILLSAALFRHTSEEIETNRRFLSDYPPAILSTRDTQTYEAFRDVCEWTYDGIDSAFFVPEAYEPFPMDGEPFIAVTFDRYPEPDISVTEGAAGDVRFEALARHWVLRHRRLQMRFSEAGKWQAYVGKLGDTRRRPASVDGLTVVRPQHRTNPWVPWKIYRHPNAVASDEPYTYFNVYANAALTLADRVHACVVTLAYGKPAMLFSHSPRAQLFDRLGLQDICRQPVVLDHELLERERAAEISFLQQAAG